MEIWVLSYCKLWLWTNMYNEEWLENINFAFFCSFSSHFFCDFDAASILYHCLNLEINWSLKTNMCLRNTNVLKLCL